MQPSPAPGSVRAAGILDTWRKGAFRWGLITEKLPMPPPVKFILNWGRRYSLWVMNFGLACCAID